MMDRERFVDGASGQALLAQAVSAELLVDPERQLIRTERLPRLCGASVVLDMAETIRARFLQFWQDQLDEQAIRHMWRGADFRSLRQRQAEALTAILSREEAWWWAARCDYDPLLLETWAETPERETVVKLLAVLPSIPEQPGQLAAYSIAQGLNPLVPCDRCGRDFPLADRVDPEGFECGKADCQDVALANVLRYSREGWAA